MLLVIPDCEEIHQTLGFQLHTVNTMGRLLKTLPYGDGKIVRIASALTEASILFSEFSEPRRKITEVLTPKLRC